MLIFLSGIDTFSPSIVKLKSGFCSVAGIGLAVCDKVCRQYFRNIGYSIPNTRTINRRVSVPATALTTSCQLLPF